MSDAPKTPIQKVPVAADPAQNVARAHHKYSPSTLQAREASPCYDPRNEESEASRAGTLQHAAFETEDLSGLTDEQAEAVEKCLAFKREVVKYLTIGGNAPLVEFEEYLGVDDEDTTAGYTDCAVIAAGAKEAHIIDEKYGQWAVEPVETNLQAFAYVLGLARKYPSLEEITFSFLLPYRDEIDTHIFKRADFPKMLLRIRAVVARAKNRTLPPQPTIGTCLFCANQAKCPALAAFALQIGAKYAPLMIPSDVSPSTVASASDATLAIKLADLMAAWAKGVRTQITAVAIETQEPPEGYRIKTSSRRKIVDATKFKEVALRGVPQEVLDAATDYSFTPIEKYISSQAPRGEKTAAVEEFGQTLIEEGAVEKGEEFSFLEMIKTKG